MKRWPLFLLATPFLLLSFFALKFAWADFLFRSGEPANIARAVSLFPSNAEYQARAGNLYKAVELNPYFSAAWMELGSHAEAAGNYEEAERYLRKAAEVDAMYDPRWALANYYFRREQWDPFWVWIRLAAERSYGDRAALFQLAWRSGASPEAIRKHVAEGLPENLARYTEWLVGQDRIQEASVTAVRLADLGKSKDAPLVLDVCEALFRENLPAEAIAPWNAVVSKGWVRGALIEGGAAGLTNPQLAWKPTGKGFDWRFPWRVGVEHRWKPGQLAIYLDGKQEERTELLTQWMAVRAGAAHELRYRYRTESLAANSGVHWQVQAGGQGLESEVTYLSSPDWREANLRFRTPARESVVRLVLAYERTKGTSRQEGAVFLEGSLTLR